MANTKKRKLDSAVPSSKSDDDDDGASIALPIRGGCSTCQSCGANVPLSNVELHRFKCKGKASSATGADSSSTAAGSPAGDGWQCGICTLINSMSDTVCGACMSPRVSHPPVARQHAHNASAHPASSSAASSEPRPPSWSGPLDQWVERKGGAAPAPPPSQADTMGPWTCVFCDAKNNAWYRQRCRSCQAWCCWHCTAQNSVEMRCCTACDRPAPSLPCKEDELSDCEGVSHHGQCSRLPSSCLCAAVGFIWAQLPRHCRSQWRPDRAGKWMLFPSTADVDKVWAEVRSALAQGLLGDTAKVSHGAQQRHVICIYTSDYSDVKDVMRVLSSLRRHVSMAATPLLNYKTDEATFSAQYASQSAAERAGFAQASAKRSPQEKASMYTSLKVTPASTVQLRQNNIGPSFATLVVGKELGTDRVVFPAPKKNSD